MASRVYWQHHKGAWAEHIAITHLLSEGFEVHRNCSAHGYADITAWRDGVGIQYDVKLVYIDKKGDAVKRRLTQKQRARGVRPLWVFPDGWVEAG